MEKPSTAKSTSDLRGDYSDAADDWTVSQKWDSYSADEHDRWRRLYRRQSAIVREHAAPEFLAGLDKLDCADGIPKFADANLIIEAATGWRLVGVPGFIPDENFFDHLANRRFPVTVWIREEKELNYLVEPDLFHDFFGHVPMLLDPVFADFLAAYGQAGERAMAMDALDMLARIYWYTVEFGLKQTEEGLKAFGAGIVSSSGETIYSVRDESVLRLHFDPVRVMRTAYAIDDFQKVYFVLDSTQQLIDELIGLDFGPIYENYRDAAPFPPEKVQDGDRVHASTRHKEQAT